MLAVHPAVAEAPVAAVLLHPGLTATAADLAAHCRARLAPFKCPRAFAFPPDLPRTSNGKVRKGELREGWRNTGMGTELNGGPMNE